jgi:hypothetical protein
MFLKNRCRFGKEVVDYDLFTGAAALQADDGRPVLQCLAAGESDDNNRKSILAVVYWWKEDRCSFYTGGDGNPKAAKAAFDKFLKDKAIKDGRRVTAMKLDHHGSTLEFNKHLEASGGQEVSRLTARRTNVTGADDCVKIHSGTSISCERRI